MYPISLAVITRAAQALLEFDEDSAVVSVTAEGQVRIEHAQFDGGYLEISVEQLFESLFESLFDEVDALKEMLAQSTGCNE